MGCGIQNNAVGVGGMFFFVNITGFSKKSTESESLKKCQCNWIHLPYNALQTVFGKQSFIIH